MDLASVIGIGAGFLLIIVAILLGGGAAAFINIPSIMITVGGTISATLISFPLTVVMQTFTVVKKVIFFNLPGDDEVIQQIFSLNQKYLKEGNKAIESDVDKIEYPFFRRGMEFVVDNVKPEKISMILQNDINSVLERHKTGQNILVSMGTFAPAFGMIGTLIGLIQMLRQLSDPSKIGAGMAVALLTTFYGALLANLLFLPMATKLKERSKQEKHLRVLIKEGVVAIAMREGKRFVEDHMVTFLSPTDREKITT